MMSDDLEIELSSDRIVLEPGTKSQVIATIRNTGNVVEVFSVHIDGIDSSWYSLPVSSVSLFPGAKEEICIALVAPTGLASKSGTYEVSIKISSKRDPALMKSAMMQLELGSVASYDLDLIPKQQKGRKGSYTIVITNTGNVSDTFKLDPQGQDNAGVCAYVLESDTVVVESGATKDIALTVIPKSKPLIGTSKNCAFCVNATSIAGEAKAVNGELECSAMLPKWAPYAITAGAAALLLMVVLVVLLVSGGPVQAPYSESFVVSPGESKSWEVEPQTGTLNVVVSWTDGPDTLSLLLLDPDENNSVIKRDETINSADPKTRKVSHLIGDSDTAAWSIHVANLSDSIAITNATIAISMA